MPRFADAPLARKMTLVILAVSSAALLVSCLAFVVYDLAALRASTEAHLVTLADVVAGTAVPSLRQQDAKALQEVLEALREQPSVEVGAIFDDRGQPLAVYQRDDLAGSPTLPEFWLYDVSYVRGHIVLARNIVSGDRVLGTIYMDSDMKEFQARLGRYGAIAAAVFVGVLALAWAASGRLQRLVSGPILNLAAAADRVASSGDFSIRMPRAANDEIGRLAEALNFMLARIEKSDESLRLSNNELRAARDRAEEATLAKSQFLANMSHEIRTPMNGILGMTRLALETELNDVQHRYLGAVEASGESLMVIINEILDFSKIEAGLLDFDPVPISLRDCLDTAVKTLAVRAHEKGLELACDFGRQVPDGVVADPVRLRQVVLNLVGNAIKFTERGEVVVRVTAEAVLGAEVALRFEVRDTGIGIPPEKLTTIFEPFTQADGSTTRRFGGTGLGLTISARLVEMMDGRIWAESEPGHGSSFAFTARFPLHREPAPELLGPDDVRGLRVLVVDDNATNRKIVTAILERWEMRPTAVADASAALAALAEQQRSGQPFDLVLTDANMPGMDGFSLAERIQQDPDCATVVMMLSSSRLRGDTARCRELGIQAYMTKPVSEQELMTTIRTQAASYRQAPRPGARPEPGRLSRPLDILLAEDNPINQTLAVILLERVGHRVTVVEDGQQVLERLAEGPFDVILMDVQMPRMDGFEATRRIRAMADGRSRRMPIIALTAHAMKGDRERCLEAGMTDYVTKPLRDRELSEVLARVLGDGLAPAPVLHRAALMERLAGDTALLRRLVALFLEEADSQLETIRSALDQHDSHALESAAHRFKGSVATFECPGAVEAALVLELMGRRKDWTDVSSPFAELVKQMELLKPALRELAAEGAPRSALPLPIGVHGAAKRDQEGGEEREIPTPMEDRARHRDGVVPLACDPGDGRKQGGLREVPGRHQERRRLV